MTAEEKHLFNLHMKAASLFGFRGNDLDNQTTLTGKNDDGTTWTYTGEVRNGLAHGKGKKTLSNGGVYEGDWVDGNRHGKGKQTNASGSVYEGDWVDNKITGKGKFTWADGDIYEGDWVDSKRTGKGKMTRSNGDVYEGDWVDNKRSGKGKLTRSNGDVYEGDWVNNEQADKEKFLSAAGSAGNVSLGDGKIDLDQLRRISQQGQTDIEKKVLQYCDPKKIAQDLVEQLKTNAAKAAQEGKREASSSYSIWFIDYFHPELNEKGPFGNLNMTEKTELSKKLFDLVKKNISDNNIEIVFNDYKDKEYNMNIINARLSW
jgi:hypothetical protein